jgi:hypothetical protein
MADVVLDARMSNSELLKSIETVLNKAGERFNIFVNTTNKKLNNIGSNLGQGFMSGFNSQLNAMDLKMKELESQSKGTSGTTSISSININDLQTAVISANELSRAFKDVDKSIRSINQNMGDLNIAKQATAEEKITLEALKRQKVLEQERTVRAQIANESQRAAKAESTARITTGGQSYTSAMAMEATSIQQRIEKMKALQIVQKNLSTSEFDYSSKLNNVNTSIQNLKKANESALTAGIQLEKHNNKLSTSFENLGKRVIFYAGLGALTGFVEQIYDIRGQYEMLERSMGAIIGSFQKGSEISLRLKLYAISCFAAVLKSITVIGDCNACC